MDPDPHGSGTFAWIRNSENSVLDPDKSFRIHNTAENAKAPREIIYCILIETIQGGVSPMSDAWKLIGTGILH